MYSNRFLEFIRYVIGDEVRIIELPVRSRNVNMIIKRLEPIIYEYRGNAYNLWVICRGFECSLCIVRNAYRVEVERVKVLDKLSGLRHMLPRVFGVVDRRIIWSARWNGESFIVDEIKCDALLDYNMRLICDKGVVKVECLDINCILRAVENSCGF